jgi:hypothetical protein
MSQVARNMVALGASHREVARAFQINRTKIRQVLHG